MHEACDNALRWWTFHSKLVRDENTAADGTIKLDCLLAGFGPDRPASAAASEEQLDSVVCRQLVQSF